MTPTNLSAIKHSKRSVSLERTAEFARALGYPEDQFIAAAMEDQLRRAGLPVFVELKKSG